MKFSTLQIHKLAIAFSEKLKEHLTPTEFLAVVDQERKEPSKGCYSHNYCDANVTMGEAFEEIVGRESNADSQEDADLWNAAWSMARKELFYHPDLTALRYRATVTFGTDIELGDSQKEELERALLAQLEQLQEDYGIAYVNDRATIKMEDL